MIDQAIAGAWPAADQDDRKSAAVAQAGEEGAPMRIVRDFATARGLLRNPDARQAGFLADLVNRVCR